VVVVVVRIVLAVLVVLAGVLMDTLMALILVALALLDKVIMAGLEFLTIPLTQTVAAAAVQAQWVVTLHQLEAVMAVTEQRQVLLELL
jgi:hypothetical protein